MLPLRLATIREGEDETYSAFNIDKNKVQPIEQVDWKGNRYWKGMILKLTAWMTGQTFQFANIAAYRQL
jgi:hypothetical protein